MAILDFIFPKTCLECGKEGKYICDVCLKKVRKYEWTGGNYSVFKYEGVIRKAIVALKYKHSIEIARELSDHIVEQLKASNLVFKNCCLVPVPLHWHRKNTRGFNQSGEVGKIVANEMEWGFEPTLLIKNKLTSSQVELSFYERKHNLKDAFVVNPNLQPKLVGYDSVVVFDDVSTTGSTIQEATKVLKRFGIQKIRGLTIAK